ncbi:MAG: helix-turn-helix domain-containing protein [Ghiorsea sp.]|nr:helix-turn-helix domain-containing protein [Ghiorsea sp.]
MDNISTENKTDESEVDENTFSKEILQCEMGEKLKKARQEKGFTVESVVQTLKFNATFLDALESGEWENLPGEVYTIGFLRQYAALLNIDITQDIERIKSRSFEMKTPEVYRDVPISPQKKWTLIAIAVFIILIIVLNFSTSEDTEVLPNDNSLSLQQDTMDLDPQNEQLLTEEFIDTYTDTPAGVKADVKIDTEPNTKEDTKAHEEPLVQKKTYSFYAATSDVWLQVSTLDENSKPQLLREALLKKGQRFSIKNTTSKLVLTTGNAGGLEVLEGKKYCLPQAH